MSDVYKIGIAIALSDGWAAPLSMLSHRLTGVHKSVKEIEGGFGRWKLAIGGAAAVFAGSALIKGMISLAEHAKEFNHELAKTRALGIPANLMGEVSAKAWENGRAVSGTSVAGNVKTIGSLYSLVGLEEALKLSTKFEKVDQILAAVGKGEQGSAYILARAGELMGKFTDPKTGVLDVNSFSGFLDVIAKSQIATHGMVSSREWLNFAKQAGPAAGSLTTEGMLTASAVIQAMGGNRAGTALAALNRQFAGAKMTGSVAKELTELGIAKPGDLTIERGGHVFAKSGAMKELVDALQKDPLDAVVRILLPALEKHGFDTNEKLSAEIYKMIGTGPAQRAIYELIRGRSQIAAERERAKGAMGVDEGYENFAKTDPQQVIKGLTAAWENLLTAMGSEGLKQAIPWMLSFTDTLNEMGAFITAHPETMKILGEGVLALGVALGVTGAAAIIAAIGTGGWLIGGLVALGAALSAMPDFFKHLGQDWQATKEMKAKDIFQYKGSIWEDIFGKKNSPDGAPGKQSLNVVPPSSDQKTIQVASTVNLDGRKVGEAVTTHIVSEGNGPAQGSPYTDNTRGGSSFDFALVN